MQGPLGLHDRAARNAIGSGHSTFCGKHYDTCERIVKAERLDLLVPTARRITAPHGAGR